MDRCDPPDLPSGLFILTRRDYIGLLLFQPIGWLIMAVGAVLYVIGILWVRKLVNMEV